MDLSPFENYQTLKLSLDKHIAHVELCRPEAFNTMNRAFWREFPQAIRAIDASSEARVLVLSSTGRHFCAGMDRDVFHSWGPLFAEEPARRGEQFRRWILQLQEAFSVLEHVRLPVLAAVQGGAIGGAVDLLCCADMRYCSEDAFFCVKETSLGIVADLGTLQRLPKLIPEGLARELIYSGRNLGAEEALNAGWVNQVFANPEALLQGVMDMARQIAQHSPLVLNGSKQMLNYSRDHSVADSLQMMATWQMGAFQQGEIMEGLKAQQENRPGNFAPLKPITPPMLDEQG